MIMLMTDLYIELYLLVISIINTKMYETSCLFLILSCASQHQTLRQRQMTVMASWNTGQSSVCSAMFLDWQENNLKGPGYCPFVRGIYWWPVDPLQQGTVTWKIFPFDDFIMSIFKPLLASWCTLYHNMSCHNETQ